MKLRTLQKYYICRDDFLFRKIITICCIRLVKNRVKTKCVIKM